MRIAIFDDYQDAVRGLACFSKLAGHDVAIYTDTPDDVATLAARLDGVDAVVLIRERTEISSALLDRVPGLRLVSQTGKISNHLDLAACTAHGVAVAEGVGSPVAPAELCWALVLAASRRLPQYWSELRAGVWQQSLGTGLGRTLKGRTLGIWGYGKIGRIVASYGRAFGMDVLVWGREPSREAAVDDGLRAAPDRETFFAESDVLSLHLRLNGATRSIVGANDLARMKPDALFVNISRAELVEPDALATALANGRPGFAAVDVFEREPIVGAADPLLSMPNVVCTPHLGYVEQASYELYFSAAFDNVVAFADGPPQNIANPEVLV